MANAPLLPPAPVGMPPGNSYWNDWYERLRTLVNATLGNIPWNRITGTPTTLAGYGITDGVSLTGTQTLTNKTMDYTLNTFLNFPGGSASVPKNVTMYTSGSGTFTPGGTTTWLRITLVGGGGGGGCANGAPGMGGAAGEVLQIWQPVSGALSYAVAAAGAAGSTSGSTSGGTGGSSTLGSLTAYGGGGGASGSSGSTPSSCGQSCMYGAGGAANGAGSASGNGQGYGAGGGGTSGSTAGAGAHGFIMIEEY